MHKPKISVIVPIYGTENYLDKCLKSIREQTLKDIEIICVDDCSPDNSYKVVERHRKQDKRIKLIRHEKNLGLGGARNTGIRAAKAEYLASVDSDDYIAANMLETLWRETDNGWFDIVCCGFNSVDNDGNILYQHEFPKKQYCNDNNNINIFTAVNPAFWNKLWRTSLFIDNVITFPNKDFYEDMSTTPRVLAKSKYIKVIQDRLYQYLIRPESISTSYGDKHILDYLRGFQLIYSFLVTNNILGVYEQDFIAYVKSHLMLHSKNVLGSGMSTHMKQEYLRMLLLIRDSFLDNYELVNSKDLGQLIELLKPNSPANTFNRKYKDALVTIANQKDVIHDLNEALKNSNHELHTVINIKARYKQVLNNKTQKLLETMKLSNSVQRELSAYKKSYNEALKKLSEDKKSYDVQLTEKKKLAGELEELKKHINQNISLYQSLGVSLFRILTKATLTDNQTKKLNNNPRAFFHDSKSKFAKTYASLFSLNKPYKFTPLVQNVRDDRNASNKKVFQALFDLALIKQEKTRKNTVIRSWDLVGSYKTFDYCLDNRNLEVFSHVSGALGKAQIACINEQQWGSGEAFLTWGNMFRNSESIKSMEVVNSILNDYKPLFIAEDGFLRSIASFANKEVSERYQQSYSIVVDDLAPYYSAYQSTRLEQMINGFDETSLDRGYVKTVINKIISAYLSKYNNQPLLNLKKIIKGGILVIDQVSHDYSVTRGGGKENLRLMLKTAVEENPGKKIFLKIHPDNIANKSNQNDFYGDILHSENLEVIDYECNSIALMEHVDKVYVFSSQLGFEAVLLGKEVQVFGLPFYSGWGFTCDRHSQAKNGRFVESRKNRISKEGVFYVAYCLYTRYVDAKRRVTTIDEVIDILIDERKEYFKENNILDELGVI